MLRVWRKIVGWDQSTGREVQLTAPGPARQGTDMQEDDYPYGCYVYVLGAEDGSRTYIGWTTDIEARLAAHNAGRGAKATRGRRWRLLYSEKFRNKSDAMSREWHLKRDKAFRRKLLAEHRLAVAG